MKYDCSKCESSFECKMTLACREENDNLETILWHPYPEEKPTEKNGYVVSVVDESNGYCFTDTSFYHPNLDRFEMDDVYQLHVYAWAEHPKPYKEVDG